MFFWFMFLDGWRYDMIGRGEMSTCACMAAVGLWRKEGAVKGRALSALDFYIFEGKAIRLFCDVLLSQRFSRAPTRPRAVVPDVCSSVS